MSDIFISHVEEDAEVALEIALGLEEAGYSTWCYELDGIPGPSYLFQTGQAVANSKAVLVVISPHSVGSRQVTKEVVRAHESDKDFIPVRRHISHIEFQNRQPEWREAIGAATSIGIPEEGAASVLPRIIAGLKNLGFQPATKPDSVGIEQIRKALTELLVPTKRPELEHGPAEAVGEKAKPAVSAERPVEAVKAVSNLRWVLAGGVLLGAGFIILIAGTAGHSPLTVDGPWYEYFFGLLIIALPFIALGAYCLRRGIAQAHVSRFTRGKIPGWWWVLPVVLGFVGGMIAWLKQRDVDWRKASNLLTLGIVLSVFWVLPFLVLQTPAAPSIPPVEPEAEPQLIYEDNFSNPHSGWSQESFEDRELSYEDGEYCILVKKFDWVICNWNRNAGLFTDFSLEIDTRLINGLEQSSYGVVFRVQSTELENYYRFLISGDGYYLVGTKTNDVWTVLQDWKKSTFIKEGNNTNHLKLVCQGSQIEIHVNEHYLATVTDVSFAEGYVGMIVDTPEPDTRVAFDNIKVYSLD